MVPVKWMILFVKNAIHVITSLDKKCDVFVTNDAGIKTPGKLTRFLLSNLVEKYNVLKKTKTVAPDSGRGNNSGTKAPTSVFAVCP